MARSSTKKASTELVKTAVLYARVSSKEQEREGYSIDAQLKLLRSYAQESGIRIVEEYVDVETAKRSGRTHFDDMVRYLKQQSRRKGDSVCRSVLVEKTDRLYRNIKDWVTLDDLELDIHFVKEGLVLTPDSRSAEKFVHGIKVLMAKTYVDNLSEETRKGMLEKAEQGIYPSNAPVGYINAECNGKRFIQPDPRLAPLVRKLFELYSSGRYSLLQVTRLIHEEGLAYRKSGAKIQKSQVYSILTNPIYYGDFRWDGRLYKGKHQPIVSKELWDRVQDTLEDKGRRNTKQQKHNWPFQGLIQCGHCGCAMVAEKKKGKYIYYHCTGNKGKCPEKFVRQEELARQFGEGLKAMQLDEPVLQWVVEALKASHDDEKRYHNEMIEKLQDDYNRLQARLDAMYTDKLDGRISQEFYDQKCVEWRREQEEILRKIEAHQNANESYIEEGIRMLELANRAYELYIEQPIENTRTLLDYVYSNCSWKGGELALNYRKPFDLIVEMQKMRVNMPVDNLSGVGQNEKWLPGLDSNQEPPG